MLCVTRASLKEHWREGCICLAAEFKYQQAFSRIVDYTFNTLNAVIDTFFPCLDLRQAIKYGWHLKLVSHFTVSLNLSFNYSHGSKVSVGDFSSPSNHSFVYLSYFIDLFFWCVSVQNLLSTTLFCYPVSLQNLSFIPTSTLRPANHVYICICVCLLASPSLSSPHRVPPSPFAKPSLHSVHSHTYLRCCHPILSQTSYEPLLSGDLIPGLFVALHHVTQVACCVKLSLIGKKRRPYPSIPIPT